MNANAEKTQEPTKALNRDYETMREDMLRDVQSVPKPPGTPQNVVAENYIVQTSSPIPELDTMFARAYAAQDKNNPELSLYALVCSTKMPIRGVAAKALLGVDVPGMVKLYAYGVSDLSGIQGRKFVLIHDRPKGRSLASIMADRPKALPEEFVIEHFVVPIAQAIQQLKELRVSHGRICPTNIFISDKVVLGECISEPCGYSVPHRFEVPERAQAMPAGKGESLPENDIYSLGVLAAYLRLGERIFARSRTMEEHIMRLLREGSYQSFTNNIDFSDGMTDLLRGTLNDVYTERWTWTQIRPWGKGRRFNTLPPTPPGISNKPLVLGGVEHSTLREVAQGLSNNWDETIDHFMDGNLYRWLDVGARRRDVAEIIRKSAASLGGMNINHSSHQRDELVARTITILDPHAPLTVRTARAHPSGIGTLLLEGYAKNDQPVTQGCLTMIEQGLAVVWADMYKRRDVEPPGEITDVLWQLDRMRAMLRISGYGFGFERVLYDLNPFLPCQSPLMADNHTITVKDMLVALEEIAANKARIEPPFDEHIAAFIGSKLNIAREAYLSEYNNVPKLSRHKSFIMLRMLEQAQDACGRPPLPALSTWVAIELLSAIEEFHSKSVRAQLQQGVRQIAAGGLLKPISTYLNQKFFASSNVDGYREAIQAYFGMSEEIATLKNKSVQKQKAAISGYAVAKSIAHIGLVIVAFMLFRDRL